MVTWEYYKVPWYFRIYLYCFNFVRRGVFWKLLFYVPCKFYELFLNVHTNWYVANFDRLKIQSQLILKPEGWQYKK